jgi:hypothetical protein
MTEATGRSTILGAPNTTNNQDIKKQFTVEMTIKITFPGWMPWTIATGIPMQATQTMERMTESL